jgi:hypothetical protein
MAKLTLRIEYDHDATDPTTEDGWKVVNFYARHRSIHGGGRDRYLVEDKNGEFIGADIGWRRKLDVGTAFFLGAMEHSLVRWYVDGCNGRPSGLIYWDWPVDQLGPKSYQDREKDAEVFIESYTEWCNGHVHWFELTDADTGEEIASVGGLYDLKGSLTEVINENVKDDDEIVEVTGDVAWLAEYLKLKNYKKGKR